MDALIFYHYSRKLTGSTFNAFEYYIAILEKNPEFKLIYINATDLDIDYFCTIFEDRYDLDDISYRENMIPMDFCKIVYLNQVLDKVLVLDYGSVWKLKSVLKCNQIIQICEKTEDPEYRFGNKLSPVVSYGEMPFVHRDKEYRMKLGFNRYKKIKKAKEAIYINAPFYENTKFLDELTLPDKPIILKASSHLNNLFEQFDEYIYCHVNKWFDPHPRLFLESAYYGKKISYYNKYDIKDGSYYRYKDLMERGLEDRTLDENDEIVQQFI